MNNLLNEARKASRDTRDCLNTIDSLQAIGLNDEAFRAVHHHHRSKAEFYSFSEGVQRYRDDRTITQYINA